MSKPVKTDHEFVAGETVWMEVCPRGYSRPRVVERVTRTQVVLRPESEGGTSERFTCSGARGRLTGSRDSWRRVTLYKMTPGFESIMRGRELRKRLDVLAGELSDVAERVADRSGISDDVMSECLAAIDGWDDVITTIRNLVTKTEGET